MKSKKTLISFCLLFAIANLSINKAIEENNINDANQLQYLNYNKLTKISNMSFPLRLYNTLPFKNEANFQDLLFNFYFSNLDWDKDKLVNHLYNFTIKATIIKINPEKNGNNIDDESFFDKNNTITLNFDKSVVLKINKTLCIKDNNEEDLYLYIKISNNNQNNENSYNLASVSFLINRNYKVFTIPTNEYINNYLQYDQKNKDVNFDLYRIDAESKDTFSLDFSSNYALSRGIYVSFLDYDDEGRIVYEDISKNSTNIEFITSQTQKGKTYHFEFKLKKKISEHTEVVFCVFAKRKPGDLKSYNYIFKYNAYNSLDERNKKYELKNEVKHSTQGNKTKLEFENIKIFSKSGEETINEYIKGEIYVRKILNKNKIKREDLDTIGIIESKYELVDGNINYNNGNKNIEIEIPKIDENDYYSILVKLPDENERFVYETINTPKFNQPIWLIVIIFLSVPLYLGIVIGIIIFVFKQQNYGLKEKILKTSFQEGVIGDNNEEKEGENVLE